MRKVVAGLFMSLDGVVSSPGPWGFKYAHDEFYRGMAEGVAQADAVLIGRRTYLEFSKLWPPQGTASPMAAFLNGAPKYVASTTLTELPWGPAQLISNDLPGELTKLKAEPGENIQVPGSPALVRELLALGMLDELALSLAPEVVGSGQKLFATDGPPAELELVDVKTNAKGLVGLRYRRR